ncbi:MBL fold metallo-hydrolase [Taibaiella sp. KBW10]|uniref:MBL fold metallo-hydrolase n=1 Tax=Taibaiella sp. KBW10 TaxID=2153357 RepID=UPI000F59751D|nr:MBL fold metallo-hydrolase [Taibaiella sp. KBW10]RQO31828.1 MBL fold metallo-hydrolase [Taibaiella sp. KBW10]
MNITFLGTGTSQGVPMIGCTCAVCTSADPKDNRLRSAVWLRNEETSVVIDSGPDFRYQMLRAKVQTLDGIVFTHGHKDHVAGLDDVRAYNYWTQKDIDIFANADTETVLRREFHYAFSNLQYPGLPQLKIHTLSGQDFEVGNLTFKTIKTLHYKLEVYGYRIGDFTYITDANYIAPEELEKIKGSKILVLNALRHEEHISHFTLSQAIAIAREVGATQTYFTHISHQLGLHEEVNRELPEGMALAYDGLTLNL